MAEIQFKNPSGDWVTWKPHEHIITVNPSDNLTSYTTTSAGATIKMDNMNDLCEKVLKEIEKGKEDMENKKYDFSKVINNAEDKFLETIYKERSKTRDAIIEQDPNYIAAKEKFDTYESCIEGILEREKGEDVAAKTVQYIRNRFDDLKMDLITEESQNKIDEDAKERTAAIDEYEDKIRLVKGLIENIDNFTEGLQLLKEYEII